MNALQQAWTSRGWLACLLWPVSLFYGAVMRLRRILYEHGSITSVKLPVPVVVVGNVVAGGGGKTPLVMSLVQRWQQQGLQVGVVSRGYGRVEPEGSKVHDCLEVQANMPAAATGDEPLLIKQKTGVPVFVAARRVDAARALLAAYPATRLLVCDDGLQHLALQRDIDITVFDDRGVGNGWLMPAGPLREPWPRTCPDHHALVLHTGKRPAFSGFTSSRQLAANAVAADGSLVPLASLAGHTVAAIAGIATPEAFFRMLEERGLKLAHRISLPDHAVLSSFVPSLPAGILLLCTEKDAVKLFDLPFIDTVKLLAVPLEFTPEPAFLADLDERLRPLLSQLPSSHGHKIA